MLSLGTLSDASRAGGLAATTGFRLDADICCVTIDPAGLHAARGEPPGRRRASPPRHRP
jgi:hypothetical protein